jgi:hypothetical protein
MRLVRVMHESRSITPNTAGTAKSCQLSVASGQLSAKTIPRTGLVITTES